MDVEISDNRGESNSEHMDTVDVERTMSLYISTHNIIAKFSSKFSNELGKDQSTVASPFSALVVLALLALTATEEVYTELLIALNLIDDDVIRCGLSAVISKIKGMQIHIANTMYLKEDTYDLGPEARENAVQVFGDEILRLSLTNRPTPDEVAFATTNWVDIRNNQQIDGIAPKRLKLCFDNEIRMALANEFHVKGTWSSKFSSENTKPRLFHLNEKWETIVIPMMSQTGDFRFGEEKELNCQLLELKLKGANHQPTVVIVLPNEIHGLDKVLQKLAADNEPLRKILDSGMLHAKVAVTIPKFKIDSKIDLTQLLPKLGVKSIFDPDIGGLDKLLNIEQPLHVTTWTQNSYIEVNEDGVNQPAVTKSKGRNSNKHDGNEDKSPQPLPWPQRYFVADRPFLMMIVFDDVPYFMATFRPTREGHIPGYTPICDPEKYP